MARMAASPDALFADKKGKDFNWLIGGKSYAAFPPKAKAETPATAGKGA